MLLTTLNQGCGSGKFNPADPVPFPTDPHENTIKFKKSKRDFMNGFVIRILVVKIQNFKISIKIKVNVFFCDWMDLIHCFRYSIF